MCQVLQVSSSGYYAWRRAPEGLRSIANRALLGKIVRKLLSISEANPAQSYSIRHVNIIDVDSGKTVENMRVTIESGRIASIHQDDTAENNNNDNVVIDAEGKFLLPGLADMHVHQLVSADVHILNLAKGVTTVRDLDGFAWMLAWRKQAR